MPYQNDMSTLADVVGPAYAAQQAGIQNDAANQEQQMKNQVTQSTMGADIQKPYLQNLFTQAQTGAEQGIAQQQQAKGAQDQALLPSNIGAGQAKNQTEIGAAKLQQFGQMGQIANQAAGLMDNIPEAARPAAMQQLAQKYGVDVQSLGPLANGDPDMLRNFGQKMIQSSADYQTKMAVGEQTNQSRENVANIQSEGRISASENAAQARVAAAQIQSRTKELTANMNQQFSQIVARLGTPQEQPGDRDRAQTLKDTMQAVSQLSAQTTQQLVGQQQLPINFGNLGGGDGGGNAQQAPSPAVSSPASMQAAKAIWPNDDPSKYVYRTGPDGNLQRKLK